MTKPLHEAAVEYADAKNAYAEKQDTETQRALLDAEDALHEAAMAGCFACGGPNVGCHCQNDD